MKSKILCWLIVSAMPIASYAVGDAEKGKAMAKGSCETCHGSYGVSIDTTPPPILAGQKQSYLIKQLQAFRSGTRVNATMQGQASALTDQNIEDLTAYFSSNSTLPSFSETKVLNLPFVNVLKTLFEAELLYDDATQKFSIKSIKQR